MKLSAILRDRNNGLTQSRVILAFFVLIDHQYALFQHPKPAILGGAITLSAFAVYMFIFMSGMLCWISRARNTVSEFLLLRIARIFPGYAVCLAFSSLLVIPALALLRQGGGSLQSLLGNAALIRGSVDYFIGNLSFTQNLFLPPALQLDHPIQAINGSLWTLQPEIMGYFLIAILFPVLASLPAIIAGIFVAASSILAFSPGYLRAIIQATLGGYGFETSTDSHLYLGIYLLAGIVYAIYSDRIDINRWLASIFVVVIVASLAISMAAFKIMSPIFLPYLFIYSCHAIRWPWGSGADFSYGVYLYSFPVQQITWSLQRNSLMRPEFPVGFALVSVVTLGLGVLSFYCVEHPSRLRIVSMMRSLANRRISV